MRLFRRSVTTSANTSALNKAQDTYHSLRASGRALFLFFTGLLIVSTLGLLYILNERFITPVPAYGGSLSEGIVGSPRFINPLLAISDADHDVTALVYSGLLKATPQGTYIADLARSYDVSEDGKTYTFYLRDDVMFHDGTPVTADDVLYTVAQAQNPAVKSPVQANWAGVAVEKVDEHTIRFVLESSYAPFIENLTLGILPSHLWQNVSDEEFPFSNLNTSPIGSGPFRIVSISRSAAGIPASYELHPFNDYALGKPYLSRLTLRFYQNEAALLAALKEGDVETASGISPASVAELGGFEIMRSPLNRVFGVFFNQNQSEILRSRDVRAALEEAIDRDALVAEVLRGYGVSLMSPVPPTVANGMLRKSAASSTPASDPALSAREKLISKGWELGEDGVLRRTSGSGSDAETVELSFALSTGNVPELRAAAEFVKKTWERMGAKVELQVFDQGDLSQNVIRPRKYDALLFGEVVGRELDLYAFWHSSQRNDPGLNIALYANATADSVLEKLRATRSEEERQALYGQFETELMSEIPAIFLYAPDFVYSVPNTIAGIELGFIGRPSDRFLSITQWHREVDYVWPFFASRYN